MIFKRQFSVFSLAISSVTTRIESLVVVVVVAAAV